MSEYNFDLEIVHTSDAYFNDILAMWQPVVRVSIFGSWQPGIPLATTAIYHPAQFHNYDDAKNFANKYCEVTL